METLFNTLAERALASDIFAGGLALGMLGTALGLGGLLFRALSTLAARRWMVSVSVDNRSATYRHLYAWLDRTGTLSGVRQLRSTGVNVGGSEIYAPAAGRYWFFRRGHLCFFQRELKERTRVGSGQSPKPMEVLTVSMLFGRTATLRAWVAEGAEICTREEKRGPGLHVLKGDWWDHSCDLSARSLDTIVADDDRITRVAEDMRWFYASSEWYRERGVPWRRGYLLHGPPGTGKSSVIRALASDLGRDLAVVNLTSPAMTDDDLRDGMAGAPLNGFLVLEDIDAAFKKRSEGETRTGVSFSGLLNAIDGVAAQEGRILIMTTNHPERLDPALIRPGRADLQVELGPVGAAAAANLFRRFFPGEEDLACLFAARLGTRRVTPAVLQGWLLLHANDARSAASADGLVCGPGAERTDLAAE